MRTTKFPRSKKKDTQESSSLFGDTEFAAFIEGKMKADMDSMHKKMAKMKKKKKGKYSDDDEEDDMSKKK